jgi:hypothetical protein
MGAAVEEAGNKGAGEDREIGEDEWDFVKKIENSLGDLGRKKCFSFFC